MQRSGLASRTRLTFILLGVLLIASSVGCASPATAPSRPTHPWMDTSLSASRRADLLLAQMTLDEKIAMLHGTGYGSGGYVGHIPANKRLGIPALNLEDGPAGVSDDMKQVTAFPAPIAGAASWDTTLMKQYGQAIGREERGKGVNVVLAPTVNILRIPQWGRSYETFGEDPYLTAQMAVGDIQGIQSQGVIATVKHFAGNNQETNRMTIDDKVDERTLQEIYLPAFHAAVQQGDVGAVMCAYNKINSIYACEQPYLLSNVLKQSWNFSGFVVSDWGATHSTVAAANAGLDMEMPESSNFGAALKTAVQNSQVSMATINDAVHHILNVMFALGLFDHPATGSPGNNVATQADAQLARQEAEQGTVLLKNDGNILPLSTGNIKSLAVIGADASTSPQVVGGGSSSVLPSHVVTPLQGITARAGDSISVHYADGSDLNQAAQTAKTADVAIVFVNDSEWESLDRSSLSLPDNQDQLIQTVAQANTHTIVVLNTGGPVFMPWVNQVPGIVEAWYPGQEDGDAIAAILFGDVNPSGKLPMTFPRQESDVPAHTTQQYPGVNGQAAYSEGIFVGYRYYDAHDITPLFPFGYGLSYTEFAYSNLSVTYNTHGTISIDFDLQNTGPRAGAEVAQIYIRLPATSVPEPPRQLKGFQKVFLGPGQTQHMHFLLDQSALSYWDSTTHSWEVQKGAYQVMVGGSSRNTSLQSSFQVE